MKATVKITRVSVRGCVSYRMTVPYEMVNALEFEGDREVEVSLEGSKIVITKNTHTKIKESDLIKTGWVKVDSDKRSKTEVWYNHRKTDGDKFMTVAYKDIMRTRSRRKNAE